MIESDRNLAPEVFLAPVAHQYLVPAMMNNPAHSQANNIESLYHLVGHLDVDALQRALKNTLTSHHALRGHFLMLEDGRIGWTLDDVQQEPLRLFPKINYKDYADDTEVRAFTEEQFDLLGGPLCRFALYPLGPHEYLFITVFHHLVFDGWSMSMFLSHLEKSYLAFASDGPLPDAPGAQFSDAAQQEQDWLNSKEALQSLDYWCDHLKNAPDGATVPYDRPAGPRQTFTGDRVNAEKPGSYARRLNDLARRESVTVSAVALLAFQLLLSEYSGKRDIAVGVSLANRTTPEQAACIGFFVNTHAVRTDLTNSSDVHASLRSTAVALSGAVKNQAIPLLTVHEKLSEQIGNAAMPAFLFRCLFICHTHGAADLDLDNVRVARLRFDQHRSKADLTLNIWPAKEKVGIQLEYNSSLYNRDTAQTIISRYQVILDELLGSLVL